MKMKFVITDITDHVVDDAMMDGDASHEGWGPVNSLYAEEYERKVDGNEWDGLPFACEASSIDDAIEKYNDAVCEYDYIKADGADFYIEN